MGTFFLVGILVIVALCIIILLKGDKFSGGKSITGQGNSDIEGLLQQAISNTSKSGLFYKQLLSDSVFMVTKHTDLPQGSHTLDEDLEIQVYSLPNGQIPLFTSKDRIFDNGIIKEQVSFIQLIGVDALKVVQGATYVVNPFSSNSCELPPSLIQSLLSARSVTYSVGSDMTIGQPSKYPKEIVEDLIEFFSKKPSVRTAYLGWIDVKSSGVPPHYIIAIDVEGKLETVSNAAGPIAMRYLGKNEFVDIIHLDEGGPVSEYLIKSTKPFYSR